MSKKKGILIVVSGFSGAGKGTLMKRLLEDYDDYALSVSATTRSPRPGEENGREYFFKTTEEFEQMIAEDALIDELEKRLKEPPKKTVVKPKKRTMKNRNLSGDSW